jgi:putative DNA primase/helicase
VTALELVERRLTEVTGGTGRGGSWPCPAHDDRNPSLSITNGDKGVLVCCHAGCTTDDVVAALGLTMADLFDETRSNGRQARQVQDTYDYTDEAGNLLFQTVRYVPKDFRQRRPDGRGDWLWNLVGARRVLYRLPDVIAAVAAGDQVWVVEGEKDVDALVAAGAVATCNPMGADSGTGNKWLPEHTATLAGADVVVVADRDAQGRRHARYVASQLEQAGCTVHVAEAAEGKDASTHLAVGLGIADFVLLDPDEPGDDDRSGEAPALGLTLVPAGSVPADRPYWAWERRIPVGGTTLMPGREGLGKTALTCWVMARLTRGELPGEWLGRPADVVYIGTEDDRASVLVPRLIAADADLARVQFVDIPGGLTFSVGVDTPILTKALTGRDVALVVVDPLDGHLQGVDTHRKAEVQQSVAKLAQLAQEIRCGALGLAHLNKGDTRDLLARVVGSVGFTTSVRSVLGVGEHPDDPQHRVCVVGKANMTDKSTVPAVRFTVEGTFIAHPDGGAPIDTGLAVILGEELGVDPNAVIDSGTPAERTALEEAVEWLDDVLAEGPVSSTDVKKWAKAADIKERTLQRARNRVGVKVTRRENEQGRPTMWELAVVRARPHGTNPLGTNPTSPLTSTNGYEDGVSCHSREMAQNPAYATLEAARAAAYDGDEKW